MNPHTRLASFPLTDDAPEIKLPRCSDCGAWHPYIAPCPYVKSRVVRVEQTAKGLRVEIVETEYFPARLKLAKQSLATEAEVREASKEA